MFYLCPRTERHRNPTCPTQTSPTEGLPMTPPTATATRTARNRPARTKKPDGQWALDGTDPLNDDERIKQEDPGLSCKQRIIELYSQQGFDSISVEDLAPRFKWVGLYSQRKQNLGGEFTSTMTNTELQDKYFMLRVRCPRNNCARSVRFPSSMRGALRTSRIAKTCSCIGFRLRICLRFGRSWIPLACLLSWAAAMFRA